MIARRLLIGGGGSFTFPPTTVNITASPEGGWTVVNDPHAVYYNGYIYLSWSNGSTGALKVAAYHPATDVTSTPVQLADLGTPDTHDAPGLLVRASDHRLMAAYTEHPGTTAYLQISVNSLDTDPTLSGGFGAAVNLDAQIGGAEYTYCHFIQLDDGNIYLWYRDQSGTIGRIAYSKSTDDGATWATRVLVVTGVDAGDRPLRNIVSDGTKTHLSISRRGAYSGSGASMHHMYLENDLRYKSDGTQITAALPLDVDDLTEFYDAADGQAIPMSVALDGSGNPYAGYLVGLDASTNSIRRAHWNGSVWTEREVAQTAIHAGDRFATGMAMDQADPDSLYAGVKVGSFIEVYKYWTNDSGATWASQAITENSATDNTFLSSIKDRPNDLRAIWLFGDFNGSESANTCGISGTRV